MIILVFNLVNDHLAIGNKNLMVIVIEEMRVLVLVNNYKVVVDFVDYVVEVGRNLKVGDVVCVEKIEKVAQVVVVLLVYLIEIILIYFIKGEEIFIKVGIVDS